MLLTLPPAFRNLLGHLQSIVFMAYRDIDDGEYYFQFCEGIDAVRLGIHTRAVSGKPLSLIFPKEQYQILDNHFSELIKIGGTSTLELRHRDSYYLLHISLVDGSLMSHDIIGNMVEITTIKRAEEELRIALEHERNLVSLKSQFLNTVSHEFRTPLTGIQISTTTLQKHQDKMSSDEKDIAINQINKRIKEITALIDMLLLQSSSKSLKELYQPIRTELSHLVSNVIADYQETMDCNGHQIRISTNESLYRADEVFAFVDPRLLKYAIRNLLSNAVKYSPNKTYVDVELDYTPSEFIISIRDYGIGMDKDDIESIFTQFYRSSAVGNISGTGLGLSIANEFVQIHNGSISVQSAKGQGSTFSIHLPTLSDTYSDTHTSVIHSPTYKIVNTSPAYG
jgi:signal transduction histidine kinase